MKTALQKRLAGKITKRSPKKAIFDIARLDEIKEAITRNDVRALIKNGAITINSNKGVSRGRAKKHHVQKLKGRRKGSGSRKGKSGAREESKRTWINKIRLQRNFLKDLKDRERVTQEIYKDLYRKAKGGFFRSERHIKLYITEHKLMNKK